MCIGSTPLRTLLTGCPCMRAYLTRPIQVARVKKRPKDGWVSGKHCERERGRKKGNLPTLPLAAAECSCRSGL